ncbi:hypothetical protein Ancab_030601 [Ancistrocladus abbreviatus]
MDSWCQSLGGCGDVVGVQAAVISSHGATGALLPFQDQPQNPGLLHLPNAWNGNCFLFRGPIFSNQTTLKVTLNRARASRAHVGNRAFIFPPPSPAVTARSRGYTRTVGLTDIVDVGPRSRGSYYFDRLKGVVALALQH